MTEHTPGPWEVSDTFPGIDIVGPDNKVVAISYSRSGRKHQKANATLIAAAPDLLAALEAVLLYKIYPMSHEYIAVIAKARAAIAKATEGTP